MRLPRPPLLLLLAGLTGPVVLPPTAQAGERSARLYDERDGLAVSETALLAEDSDGFIWIGTMAGLVRFDGSEMRSWAPESLRHVLRVLATSPDGQVVAAGLGEPLWRVERDGVARIPGPGGGAISGAVHAAFDADSRLWVTWPDSVGVRQGIAWRLWPKGAFQASALLRAMPWGGDTMAVASDRELRLITPAGPIGRAIELPRVRDLARSPDGSRAALTADGRVVGLHAGGARLLYGGVPGGIALVARGPTLWATIDRHLVALAPGRAPEIVSPRPGVSSGRPLLVDHEGTLWVGSFRGLLAMPEPATVAWNELDGLPEPAHMHSLTRDRSSLWAIGWYGTVRVDLGGGERRISPLGRHSGRLVLDGRERLWGAEIGRGFFRSGPDGIRRFGSEGLRGIYGAARRPDGALWLATDDGLFLTPPGDGPPLPVRAPPPPGRTQWRDTFTGPMCLDRHGRLWLADGDRLLSADADSLERGQVHAWSLDPLVPMARIGSIVETESDGLWLASLHEGVLRRGAAGWETVPGQHSLGTLRAYGLAPARSGGLWLLGAGAVLRVRPDRSRAEGWEVLERLGSWQGLPAQQASDLVEDPDGRLWLATIAGLVEVPPEARRARPGPPRVELVEVRVDGRRLPLGESVRLPWNRNRIELRFAALSRRAREAIRFESRLRPGAEWTETRDPVFRLADLRPGRYAPEVRAAIGDGPWSEAVSTSFVVLRPWWQHPGAFAAGALAIAALAYAAHRLRVRTLLGLERQRTRIAMDLHDEMGSGLGSIGILAGIAEREDLGDRERRALAHRIRETASELGGSLSDLVQSLRHGSDTLEALALALSDRARRLLPEGGPRFVPDLPRPFPRLRIAPEPRRVLQLLLLEALYNAMRHARAGTIALGFSVTDGEVRAWVEDDGIGMAGAGSRPGGHGLPNMRARAEQLGGTISWTPAPLRGTRVEVRLPRSALAARPHMSMRATRGRDAGTLPP